jgi:hypothetical protein
MKAQSYEYMISIVSYWPELLTTNHEIVCLVPALTVECLFHKKYARRA